MFFALLIVVMVIMDRMIMVGVIMVGVIKMFVMNVIIAVRFIVLFGNNQHNGKAKNDHQMQAQGLGRISHSPMSHHCAHSGKRYHISIARPKELDPVYFEK